jgi:hypothetical protein
MDQPEHFAGPILGEDGLAEAHRCAGGIEIPAEMLARRPETDRDPVVV